MKIGIICYPTFGGSGIVASELGLGLLNKHEIHFISYEKPVRLDLLKENIYYHKVNIPTYPLFEYPPYELALAARISEVVECFDLDVLHVHYAIPHAYAAVNAQQILLEKNIIIPIVTTLHGTDITLVGKSPFVLSAVNYAINKSSLVTCVSEDLKQETLTYFNIKNEIKVIPNFINLENGFSPPRILNNKKKITHISNFRPVKRIMDVIRVFVGICDKIDAELIMIGEGPDLSKAKSLVKEYNLESCVSFLGKSKNIDSILKETDLFLLPSESESFGLVALEAMSFGVPVITTNSGGITELVKDSETGYACSVGDIVNMSRVSIDLLSDSDLYSTFSANAYRRAKMYDINTIIPLYEECYATVLSS
jgi:N-acetyl-alpha-D-glucosaminyl L-malate synthase BshA